jgi:hypothetical protein
MVTFSPGKQDSKDEPQKSVPAPRPVSPPPAKEVDIPMRKIEDVIRRSSMIPGGGGKGYYGSQEREEIKKEVRKVVGSHLEEGGRFEKTRLFRRWVMERGKAKDQNQRNEIDRKIRYMEKVIKQAREEMQRK